MKKEDNIKTEQTTLKRTRLSLYKMKIIVTEIKNSVEREWILRQKNEDRLQKPEDRLKKFSECGTENYEIVAKSHKKTDEEVLIYIK